MTPKAQRCFRHEADQRTAYNLYAPARGTFELSRGTMITPKPDQTALTAHFNALETAI